MMWLTAVKHFLEKFTSLVCYILFNSFYHELMNCILFALWYIIIVVGLFNYCILFIICFIRLLYVHKLVHILFDKDVTFQVWWANKTLRQWQTTWTRRAWMAIKWLSDRPELRNSKEMFATNRKKLFTKCSIFDSFEFFLDEFSRSWTKCWYATVSLSLPSLIARAMRSKAWSSFGRALWQCWALGSWQTQKWVLRSINYISWYQLPFIRAKIVCIPSDFLTYWNALVTIRCIRAVFQISNGLCLITPHLLIGWS